MIEAEEWELIPKKVEVIKTTKKNIKAIAKFFKANSYQVSYNQEEIVVSLYDDSAYSFLRYCVGQLLVKTEEGRIEVWTDKKQIKAKYRRA